MNQQIVEALVMAVALVTAMVNLASALTRVQELERRTERRPRARGGRHRK